MGKVAAVPADISPLQLGTRGQHDDRDFELVGRIRWRWSGGAWNEWVMLFADGAQGWLGDAACRYTVMFERPGTHKNIRLVQKLSRGEKIEPGEALTLGGARYEAIDIRDVECAGSEGELPFSTPLGLSMSSIDLINSTGLCASIQKDRGQVSVYQGRHVSLAELRPINLRRFEGWTMPEFAR